MRRFGLVVLLVCWFLPTLAWPDITSNQALWWKLDEGSGTSATDSSGGSSAGTFGASSAAPTWLTSGSCQFSNCVSFDGVDDRITYSVPLSTSWTFATWIYSATAGTGQYKALMVDDSNSEGLYLNQSGSNNNKIKYYDGAEKFSTGTVPRDTWTHIAVVNNAGTLTFYINGSASGTASISTTITASIVGLSTGEDPFQGRLDEYRIYTRALSGSDITELVAYTPGGGGGVPPATYTFDHTILSLPTLTYGPSAQTCETPGAGDTTLTTGSAWESAVESAGAGARFFFRAGTYTATSLDIPAGSAGARIVLKAYNCEAVTLNALVRPGHYTTIDGLTLRHLTGSPGGEGTVDLPSARTGVVIRNANIISSGHYNISLKGAQTDLLIERNNLEMDATALASAHNVFINTAGTNAVFSANKIRNSTTASRGEDLVQFYNWSGTWTFTRNWFRENTAEDYLDIKYSSTSAPGAVLHVLENYFQGTAVPNGECVMLHNASDTGVSGGYSYTVHVKGNYFPFCPEGIYHRVSTGTGEGNDKSSRTLNATYNVLQQASTSVNSMVIESNNATIEHNTFLSGNLKTGANGNNPTNVVVRNNIFYQGTFQNQGNISTCSHNDFFSTTNTPSPCTSAITTNPNFVNASSDWTLQAGSGAIGTASDGLNIGATQSSSPPTITITQPTSGTTYATSTTPLTTLQGTASADTTLVTWTNSRGGAGTATGTTAWSVASITLQSGENLLTLTAVDADNLAGVDTITVTYTPPILSVVPQPSFMTTGFLH
jgi:hypothetical protein